MPGQAAPALRYLTLACFFALCLAEAYFLPPPMSLFLAALGGFLVMLASLGHPGLALAAALAPLPGILWFGPSAYALAVAFTFLMAYGWNEARLKNEDVFAGLWSLAPALCGALLFALAWSFHDKAQLGSLIAASAASLLCFPVLAATVPFGEDEITRANRRREKFLRYAILAAPLGEPRWSISVSGVGLVLAALGWFDMAHPLHPLDWLAAPGAGLLMLFLTRDIRGALAGLAASGLLLLFAGAVNGALLLFLVFALDLGCSAARWRKQGENESHAWMRTIEDCGPIVLAAGLTAMVVAIPRGGFAASLHAFYGLAAALIFYPAFTGALYAIFPRRRSVEELYGSRV